MPNIFGTALEKLDIEAPDTRTGQELLRANLDAASEFKKKPVAPSAPTLRADAEENAKRALWADMEKQMQGGATQDEAFGRRMMADVKLNGDTEHTNFEQSRTGFLDDPMVHQATMEAGTAQDELALAKKTAEDFAKNLENRWDTSIKDNINTLTNLAADPKYLEWLSALGIDPSTMMKLSQGREGYINDYVQNIKNELEDDIAWMDNLDKITLQAEKDWNAKTRVMREEQKRVMDRNKPQDFEYKVLDGKPYNYDRSTGKMTEIDFSSTVGGTAPAGLATPGGNKYAYSLIDDAEGTAIRLNLMEGQPLNDPNTERNEGWCGSFGNDILGIPSFFGNSLKDKNAKRNSSFPQTGGFGIMDVGDDIGHIFFVEKVYRDGSIDIAESNWKVKSAPGTFGRRYIEVGSADANFLITGYYNPKVEGAETRETELNTLVERYNMATTDSGKQKIQDEATDLGVFSEFSVRVGKEPEEDKRNESTKIMDEFLETVTPENYFEKYNQAVADLKGVKAFGKEIVDIQCAIDEQIQARRSDLNRFIDIGIEAEILGEVKNAEDAISRVEELLEGYTEAPTKKGEEGGYIPPMSPEDTAETLKLAGILEDIPGLAENTKPKWGAGDIAKGLFSPGIPLGKLIFEKTDFERLEKLFEKRGVSLRDLL